MRRKKTSSNLRLYAVSGTNTILLSIDLIDKPDDLLGFSFERVETKSKKRIWLFGQKFFKSVINIAEKDLQKVKGQKYPTYLHPVQSFLWKDFTPVPDTEYTYIVTALRGEPVNPKKAIAEEITISTEKHIKGQHGIYFNRGVSGSQSYAEQFNNERPFDENEKVLNQKAVDWLSRGLYEGMKEFVASAKKGDKIRGACYEFNYVDFIKVLKDAKKRGVDVNVVYDAINYGDENKAALKEAAALSLVKVVRDNQVTQAHNKFFVLLDKNDNPLKVWTGSTNISMKGIFGHCNTGHLITDKNIAARYYEYWKLVYQNLDRKTYRTEVEKLKNGLDISADNIPDGISVMFSPRKTKNMLQQYANMMDNAKEMVCCIYPFNIDKRFQAVFQEDKPYIRYILLDKRMKSNTFTTNDKDVEVTAGSMIKADIDQWVTEINAGKIIKGGINYLHNKIILIDPLGNTPIVISGSANYSEGSIFTNDENTLIIKGNEWVADIYFTEYIRLFDHFSFREWLNENHKAFYPYLDETYKWVDKYYDPEHLNLKRKDLFKNMAGAVESK